MGKSNPEKKRIAANEGPAHAAEASGPAAPLPGLVPQLWQFRLQYRDGREDDKVLRAATKLAMDLFGAAEGAVVVGEPGPVGIRLQATIPEGSAWDRTMLSDFLRGRKVRIPPELMLARIRRKGRMWGILAVRDTRREFNWDARQGFSMLGSVANEIIDGIDRERIREVRARVDRKILEQSLPKHLSYELLHGIRSLTGYDHSAALLIHDGESGSLEIVAEQIAWQKAKGRNVGRKLPLPPPLREVLDRPYVCGFDRNGKGWINWTGTDTAGLADLLDYDEDAHGSRAGGPDVPAVPAEGAILCASLATKGGLLGILKIASVHPGAFCAYEVDLISQFLPQAAVALQNAQRAELLEQRVLIAERKHAMAELARGVSHDVNNALGAVLPMVQQLVAELDEGDFDAPTAAEDLRRVERSIQVCKRIFGAMVHFARGTARNPSAIVLNHAVDGALAIFREGLVRRGVGLTVDVPADLPPLLAVQADVEQLFINLLSNARDATGPGQNVSIRARFGGGAIEVVVEDDGCGMPAEHLARVKEPFFTTKANGHGLGLAICRSIMAELRGQFHIDSSPGAGTRVRAVFPISQEESAP
ncbi:ATP-binding protein [Aquisphaera insulae]|uniref:ATP-binding protein n=1 Tax=Aquisphaera insulae TaxID=2712864 RepID=UPI0013EB7590|nr:ATP-binding protein [Aquisphaera insulae]